MKHVAAAIICLAVCTAVAGCKKEDPDRIVRVYSIVGEVMIAANAAERPAVVGDVLSAGDGMRTGDNSMADILFGTAGIIRIQPGTSVSIALLMDQTTGDSQIDMPAGKMNVTLAKLKKGDFRVKTGTAVAAVRGTTFRITADGKATRLDVVTGAVRINPVRNDAVIETVSATVESNQTVELDEAAVKQAVEKKKEITVIDLRPEVIEEIREEVKDVKPGILEKLNDDARREVKEKILVVDDSAAREREEKEKTAREKKEKERAMKLLRDRESREMEMRKKTELENQRIDEMKKKKKKDDDAGHGSPSLPPSVNTL